MKSKKHPSFLKIGLFLMSWALMLIPSEALAVRGLTELHAKNTAKKAVEKGLASNHQGAKQALGHAQDTLAVYADIYSAGSNPNAHRAALSQVHAGLTQVPVAKPGEEISAEVKAALQNILTQLNTGQHQEAIVLAKESRSNMRDLHVVYAANNEVYLTAAGVSIFSVMENAHPHDFYHFYVYVTKDSTFSNGIPLEYQQAFHSLEAQFPGQCSVSLIPLDTIQGAEGINLMKWGLAALIRIILPEYLSSLDKVIYVDCDMIAMKDLRIIDDALSMNDKWALAGVKDISPSHQQWRYGIMCKNHAVCNFTDGDEYINSGLLVMNLKRLREEQFTATVLTWLKNQPHTELPDQDSINVVWKGKIKALDFTYAWSCLNKATNIDDIALFHYMAESKPWLVGCSIYKGYHADFYNDYKSRSPFSHLQLLISCPTNVGSYGSGYGYGYSYGSYAKP